MSLALAILAGGRGVRLGGVPKGLLRRGGRTLVDALLELGHAFDETLIVANEPGPYDGKGARIVRDLVPGRGAPGGVHAALAHARSEWVVVLACDMPFVTPEVLSTLLRARSPEVDVAAYEVSGALQPLPSLWRATLAEPLGGMLPGQPSLRALCEAFRLHRLGEEALAAIDPGRRAVLSVNQPEDLERFGVGRPDSGQRD